MRVLVAVVACLLCGCASRPVVKLVAESGDLKRVSCRVEVTL